MRSKTGRRFLFIATLVVSSSTCGYANDMRTAEQHVTNISTALSRNQIGRVEIVQIPRGVATRAAITPEMLERQYHFKLIIRDVFNSARRDRLVEALRSVSVEPRDDATDLRWGIIFYLRNSNRAGALYFDRTGRYGAVNDEPVSFKGEFFSWLDGALSDCFK